MEFSIQMSGESSEALVRGKLEKVPGKLNVRLSQQGVIVLHWARCTCCVCECVGGSCSC